MSSAATTAVHADATPRRSATISDGSAAGTTTCATIVRARYAHRAGRVDQSPVDAAHTGHGAEQYREKGGIGHDEHRQRIADAEYEQRQRNPARFRKSA